MPRPRRSRRSILRVLDLLGRRWALRVLWELRHGARTFRALREACDAVSPSSLNQRLSELRGLGVVELGADGYRLTRSGERLARILLDLYRWAEAAPGSPRPAPRARRGRRASGPTTVARRDDRGNTGYPPSRRTSTKATRSGRRHGG